MYLTHTSSIHRKLIPGHQGEKKENVNLEFAKKPQTYF